jgi:hypothetical protein
MILGLTIGLIVVLLAIIISSLPLYLAVKLFGGKTSILNVFLTNILVGIVSIVLMKIFGLGSLIVLLFTIILYSIIFEMGLIRSFFAWFIQYIIAALLVAAAILILGISLIV